MTRHAPPGGHRAAGNNNNNKGRSGGNNNNNNNNNRGALVPSNQHTRTRDNALIRKRHREDVERKREYAARQDQLEEWPEEIFVAGQAPVDPTEPRLRPVDERTVVDQYPPHGRPVLQSSTYGVNWHAPHPNPNRGPPGSSHVFKVAATNAAIDAYCNTLKDIARKNGYAMFDAHVDWQHMKDAREQWNKTFPDRAQYGPPAKRRRFDFEDESPEERSEGFGRRGSRSAGSGSRSVEPGPSQGHGQRRRGGQTGQASEAGPSSLLGTGPVRTGPCAACGQQTHALKDCAIPDKGYGCIGGCAWCNTLSHELDHCKVFKNLKPSDRNDHLEALFQLMVVGRVNMPALRSSLFPWSRIVVLMERRWDPEAEYWTIPSCWPWSNRFAMEVAVGNPEALGDRLDPMDFDPTQHDAIRDLPADPLWHSWTIPQMLDYAKEGNLEVETFTTNKEEWEMRQALHEATKDVARKVVLDHLRKNCLLGPGDKLVAWDRPVKQEDKQEEDAGVFVTDKDSPVIDRRPWFTRVILDDADANEEGPGKILDEDLYLDTSGGFRVQYPRRVWYEGRDIVRLYQNEGLAAVALQAKEMNRSALALLEIAGTTADQVLAPKKDKEKDKPEEGGEEGEQGEQGKKDEDEVDDDIVIDTRLGGDPMDVDTPAAADPPKSPERAEDEEEKTGDRAGSESESENGRTGEGRIRTRSGLTIRRRAPPRPVFSPEREDEVDYGLDTD
ncbi:hypothetical protein VTJ04DRAFT_4103 [Mycothermus thermophilus]|uniref:uncharacterized protein n=1 Tax=Humicola insolens TaxID=85995 RepID=UPI0037449FC5